MDPIPLNCPSGKFPETGKGHSFFVQLAISIKMSKAHTLCPIISTIYLGLVWVLLAMCTKILLQHPM